MKLKKCVAIAIFGIMTMIGSFWYTDINVKADDVEELDDWLEVNEDNFPDENFRKCVLEGFDIDGDGKINPENPEWEYCFRLSYMNISSLKGIEYFKNIEILDISHTNVDSLDLSEIDVYSLNISFTPIKTIDISSHPELCRGYEGGVHGMNGATDMNPGYLYIDNTQIVISSEPIKAITIMVPEIRGNIYLNNLSNFDSSFLNGVEKANSLSKLSFNSDDNILYYDLTNNYGDFNYDIRSADYENVHIYSDYYGDDHEYFSGRKYKYYECSLSYDEILNYVSEYEYEYENVELRILYGTHCFSAYEGFSFYKDDAGNVRCYDSDGNPVINEFKCDGTYTYYFQADGTAMKDRLTYHPDGEHVIYFDSEGHEVFSDFANVKKTIAGDEVNDFCFFDVFGYMYVDVVTYDKTGTVLYYANAYGVMEMGKWFQFSDNVTWADGREGDEFKGGYGYANTDGTLMTNTQTTDWEGRNCYLQGNGVALY